MGTMNRRTNSRVPLELFLNEYVKDRPHRCLSYNLSPDGMFLNRVFKPEERARVLGLEFELPGTSEVIWARGEVRFDAIDDYLHGTGVQFTGMARLHQRLINDYVAEKKAHRLRELLSSIRRNRLH